MSKAAALPISSPEASEPVRVDSAAEFRRMAIRAGVLRALGVPADLFRVAVMPLWGNHFRVNVVTGENAVSVTIPYSYFVTADEAGKILASAPDILKQH